MSTPRPSYDQALKRMLTQAHDGFLALLLPGAVWEGELSPELPNSSRLADFVWAVKYQRKKISLHIELQTKVENNIGERMAEYGFRIWQRHRLPPHTFVVYLRPSGTIPQPPFTVTSSGKVRTLYEYDTIRLWELDPAQVLSTPYHTLWPLAGLMGGVTADTTLAVAEQIASAPIPRHDQIELTGLLALLASVRIDRNTIMQVLGRSHMIEELLNESSFREVVQLMTLRDLARDVVKAHFPAAGDDLLTRIDTIDDTDVLRRIIVEIGTFPDLATITATIDAAQPTAQP